MFEMVSHASIVAMLSMVVGILPAGMGVAYALRPTDARLALMRPLSLASIFSGLTGSLSGIINILSAISATRPPVDSMVLALASAETIVPLFVAFASLTVAWLCAAAGLSRQS